MKPIADALDFLQREKTGFYGHLVPTLTTLMRSLSKISNADEIITLKDVSRLLIDKIRKRFGPIFHLTGNGRDVIIASVLCPDVKLRWLKSMTEFGMKNSKEDIVAMVITACKEFEHLSTTTESVPSEVSANYFDFGDNGNLKKNFSFRKP